MKKNINLIIMMCFMSIFMSGCNKYISAKVNDSVYYGLFNRRDFTHADVKMYKQDSSVICDGMIFINSPSRAITLKNDLVEAKMVLGCSDKRIINADLKMEKAGFDNPTGTGVDQLDNKYEFSTISKEVFKKNIKVAKIKLVDDKQASLLKY